MAEGSLQVELGQREQTGTQERTGGAEEKCCIHDEKGPEHDLFPCNGTRSWLQTNLNCVPEKPAEANGWQTTIGCSYNIQREIMFCRKERTNRAPGGKRRTLKITGLRNQNKRVKMRPEFLITVYREDGYPGSSDVKESACNAGDPGSITGSGRSPGEGNGNPLQYSCLQNFMNRGAWWATVHGVAQSRTRLSD